MIVKVDEDNFSIRLYRDFVKGKLVGLMEVIPIDELLEVWADRKTENSSEKPNNSTISKMEQVDKPQTYITEDRDTQILDAWQVHHRNTTSVEDEPQTESSTNSEKVQLKVQLTDEPQTDTEIAKAIVHKMIDDAVIAEDAYPDLRQKMHNAVDEYEPQTDCAWR